jgi:hypothetical protein
MEADIKKRIEVDVRKRLELDIEEHEMLRAKHKALQGVKDKFYPKCES